MADVIVALDYDGPERALEMVDALGEDAEWFKVGLELFTRTGPGVVEALVERGKRVFLDLKLHDIPNTVAGAVRSVAGAGAGLLTVHAAGGGPMIRAAVDAAEGRLDVVAVTVLTSLGPADLARVFGTDAGADAHHHVLRLAGLAQQAGAAGVVCSAHEAAAIRVAAGRRFTIVTPGIRLQGGEAHDQARVMTPAQAVAAGSDYLVLGRAVTGAPHPAGAFREVVRQASGAEALS